MFILSFLFMFLASTSSTLPKFEVYWESGASYEDVDEELSPWHVQLGKKNYETSE